MRRHVTNALEFQEAGLLLAGDGDHSIRVLGAFAAALEPAGPDKEALGTDAAVFDPYFAGDVRGDQQDPDARPFHPTMPAPHLTRSGELEFLFRDWSGIDLDSLAIPALPDAPGTDGPPAPAPDLDPSRAGGRCSAVRAATATTSWS